jgi:hypothetical protein
MKLSISCRGGHTEPTMEVATMIIGFCNLLNEVQIPVAVSAIRNWASRSQATLFAYSME